MRDEIEAKVRTGRFLQPQYYQPEAAAKLFKFMEERACVTCGQIKNVMTKVDGKYYCSAKCWRAYRKKQREELNKGKEDAKAGENAQGKTVV